MKNLSEKEEESEREEDGYGGWVEMR